MYYFRVSIQPLESTKMSDLELTKPRHYDSAFAMPPNQPFILLDAKNAFEKLTEREKLYSHYLARASFFGGLIVLVQTSPESPQVKEEPHLSDSFV